MKNEKVALLPGNENTPKFFYTEHGDLRKSCNSYTFSKGAPIGNLERPLPLLSHSSSCFPPLNRLIARAASASSSSRPFSEGSPSKVR